MNLPSKPRLREPPTSRSSQVLLHSRLARPGAQRRAGEERHACLASPQRRGQWHLDLREHAAARRPRIKSPSTWQLWNVEQINSFSALTGEVVTFALFHRPCEIQKKHMWSSISGQGHRMHGFKSRIHCLEQQHVALSASVLWGPYLERRTVWCLPQRAVERSVIRNTCESLTAKSGT